MELRFASASDPEPSVDAPAEYESSRQTESQSPLGRLRAALPW